MKGYRESMITSANFMMYLTSLISLSMISERFIRQMTFYLISESKGVGVLFDLLDSNLEKETGKSLKLTPPISIAFEDLWFQYEEDGDYILKGLNLEIKKGETVALVGKNGAGKSTIISLLTGFYEPTKGRILLNGVDIKDFNKKDLLKYFNGVFQKVHIFPVHLAHNISFEDDPNTEKVWTSLEGVGLKEKFERVEKGFETQILSGVYNNSVGLSGGESQKISIARAIYKNAPITLLDEPTTALDALAEYDLYQDLHKTSENKTSIYISHRLSSTKFCDWIIYLEDGKVLEEGSHEELLEKDGEDARVFKIQGKYYQEEENH